MSTFLSAYENMDFTYYIDKATYQYVRMEIDLTGVMRSVMANMGALEEADMSFDQYSIVMDISDINKVKPFGVPKRILNNAEDMGDMFGAGSMGIIGGADGPTSIITNDGYFDQIDWEAMMEADEAALEAFVDADGNIDYQGTNGDYWSSANDGSDGYNFGFKKCKMIGGTGNQLFPIRFIYTETAHISGPFSPVKS